MEQISEDLEFGDTTALEELLRAVPDESLKSYLPEEEEEAALCITETKT